MDRNVCLRSVVSFQVSTIADCSQVLFDTIKRVLGNLAIPISLEIVFHGSLTKISKVYLSESSFEVYSSTSASVSNKSTPTTRIVLLIGHV
jgi:hypothetical protein